MGSEWHAPYELLKPEAQDMARALNSLQGELEAMDWYNQRIDVTHDEKLRGIRELAREKGRLTRTSFIAESRRSSRSGGR